MRIVLGITGATGTVFGVRSLEIMHQLGVETHLVVSAWGARTLQHETGRTVADLAPMAAAVHRVGDQAAAISSGSFHVDGMLIAPCSAKTLAAIAHGYASDLVSRAADVALKERRKLVVLFRETPLNRVQIDNMLRITDMGAIVMPPVPAFYNHPESLEDMVDHIVVRALDQFGLDVPEAKRWTGGLDAPSSAAGEEPTIQPSET